MIRSFGTGKVGPLAGFTSAIVLGLIALIMGYESIARLAAPVPIDFGTAMLVAALGLALNLASAFLLGGEHHHHDHADHKHDDGYHDHEDGMIITATSTFAPPTSMSSPTR